MGTTCCHPSTRKEEEFVRSEEFVETLARHSQSGKDDKQVRVDTKLIETILLKESDDNEPVTGKHRVSDRRSADYLSKDDFQVAVASIDTGSTTPAPSKEAGGRVKERKGTGFVTKEKLLSMLDSFSDDEDEGPALPLQPESQAVPTSTAAADPKSPNRCKVRKGTGFVSKAKLKRVLAAVGEEEDE
mmetsp:Transcript_29035/g.67546  ORF Transcript_29035/g.67546 Transcript_29035/m.67546 type:complete len:187 (+) Transcript_29035:77-637(+)|eukprot:CAMPEP_0171097162 /NCGR_PEP_ID=MMETSP0766_2-20121228/47124_1 /TAXON_ID=439317 /ORGANISM="Gambierdiscus australes, Strain CAWD 149" /LENGTH=186 /DNA_ID=CAMNT_0011556311 /DNA_START=76 /DNA_END=636 /DNA_ORIENTATION=-